MKTIIVSIGLLFCMGCGASFHIDVDSISSGDMALGSKCIILPLEPEAVSQLHFKEYTPYIKRALENKGYNVTGNKDEAQLAILIEYGVSGPRKNVYSYDTTDGVKVGTSTSHTMTIVLDAYDLDVYRKTQKKVQAWKTTVMSTGSSADLRRVFPVMIAAASKYIGENTGKQIRIKLFENDKRVEEIKGLQEQ